MILNSTSIISYFIDIRFIACVFAGSAAGLFAGAIPGLSVSMATALLVSITYSWQTEPALGMIMGVYITGVFSGAISAILINIPGAPSSVVTTLDGYPLAKKGSADKALRYAAFYSFAGSVFGLCVLAFAVRPLSKLALQFTPVDYFLIALFGLTACGLLTSKKNLKGFASAMFGLIFAMIGVDSISGTARLTFGIYSLVPGIGIVPALIGLFGFSEVLFQIAATTDCPTPQVNSKKRLSVNIKEMLKHWRLSLYSCVIGVITGVLPGAGGNIASFLAYGEAKRIVKKPSAPFGEGAIEGIVASESANNACIGGALIPMLALAVPGDSVTAIILSVFYIHGLRPGPLFLRSNPEIFSVILAGGFLSCVFLLALGFFAAPRISWIISVPKRLLLPVVITLCVTGAFAYNNRLFDVLIMLIAGILGYIMRRRDYPTAPMTLGLVLGGMMDSEFRRAVSLASSEDNILTALFCRPITIVLLMMMAAALAAAVKRSVSKRAVSARAPVSKKPYRAA